MIEKQYIDIPPPPPDGSQAGVSLRSSCNEEEADGERRNEGKGGGGTTVFLLLAHHSPCPHIVLVTLYTYIRVILYAQTKTKKYTSYIITVN